MSWRTSNLSDLILDNEVPNFQIFFGDEKVLEDFGKSAKELEKKFFKSNGGAWREFPDLVEAEFLKVNLLSEDFMAFRFPKLSEKIFICREENYKDYKRFRVLQIGYFDVSEPFYKEEFFVQVASDSIQNYMGNNKYFDETVWEKWKETESFKIGKERVLDQNEIRKVSEIEKLEKESESLKNSLPKQQEQKEGFYIWNGKDIEDFGISVNTFKEFKDKYLNELLKRENFGKLQPKDEFETESEFRQREIDFQRRKDRRSKELLEKTNFLNSYLGSQKVEMKYNPEKGVFDVKFSNRFFDGNFQIEIPRNIAKEFKSKVKNFDFHFSENLVLENISVQFQNKTYFGKIENFDLAELEREREIASKTVSVGNLMFQDFDLPERMNLQDSCHYCEKLKLLGFSDWRLPNKKELKIAQNNKNRFRNLQSTTDWYWSISKHFSSESWIVDFDSGDDYWSYLTGSSFAVCVRDL
jgi:hypothetical protein